MKKLIAPESISQWLAYDPHTGTFTWKVNKGPRVRAGSVAGSSDGRYFCIGLEGTKYRAHRLAFVMMTGRWPGPIVDHRNRDTMDNRWENLREASPSESATNRSFRNSTGYRGVKVRTNGSFEAYIKREGKRRYLGTFVDASEAHSAYVKAARAGFGEFACFE